MLQAALNGSRPEDAHPALPVQARHLARDARAVARLGVTSVHVHPRGPDTLETLEPVHVGDAVAAIRTEVPSMEIGVDHRALDPARPPPADRGGASRGAVSAWPSPTSAR